MTTKHSIVFHYYNTPQDNNPSEADWTFIPNQGDFLRLNSPRIYRVTKRLFDWTEKGSMIVYLQLAESVAMDRPGMNDWEAIEQGFQDK